MEDALPGPWLTALPGSLTSLDLGALYFVGLGSDPKH